MNYGYRIYSYQNNGDRIYDVKNYGYRIDYDKDYGYRFEVIRIVVVRIMWDKDYCVFVMYGQCCEFV